MKRSLLFLAVLLLGASNVLAFNVLLKNGSIIFAREPYVVKGKKAIITLQNGTIVSYDLDQIDIPGTEQYNKENPGNVIAIQQGESKELNVPALKAPPTVSLQEVIRQRKMRLGVPPAKSAQGTAA